MYRPDQFLKHAKDQLHSEVSRETIDEIRAADESRVSEKANTALSERDRSRLKLRKDLLRRAHIADGVEREANAHRESALDWHYRDRLANAPNPFLEDLDLNQIEHDEVQSNIERIRAKSDYLDSRWPDLRDHDDIDTDKMELLLKQRKYLESILQREQQRLNELKRRTATRTSRELKDED